MSNSSITDESTEDAKLINNDIDELNEIDRIGKASKPSQRNVILDRDSSQSPNDNNNNTNDNPDPDVVVVEKPSNDQSNEPNINTNTNATHEIEDKPLTIDMTPRAVDDAGLLQESSNNPTNNNNNTKDRVGGTPVSPDGNEQEREQQSLLDVELNEGKPTTVRGEKAEKKRQKKLSKEIQKQHNKENKHKKDNNHSGGNVLLSSGTDTDIGGVSGTSDNKVTPGGEMEEDEYDEETGNIVVVHDTFCERLHRWFSRLYESGALLSFAFTLAVWGLFIWLCVKHNLESIIIFIVMYIVYLVECWFSQTYRDICKAERADTVSVKVLDALKESAPVIHWHIECYRIETKYSLPDPNKKIILWLYGKDSDCYVLKKAGYRVECFQSEWTIVNFMSDPMNYPKIAAIILPIGQVIGFSQLQRSITKHFTESRGQAGKLSTVNQPEFGTHQGSNSSGSDARRRSTMSTNPNDAPMPVFLKWHEKKPRDRMTLLIQDCVRHEILRKTRSKVTSKTNDETYKFKHWRDISEELPQWRNTLTNLTIEKSYVLKDRETRMDYDSKKSEFRDSEENNCDEQQSFEEKLKIRGFKKHMLVKLGNSSNTGVPWWMTRIGFWMTSLLMFTIIPRILVYGMEDVTWHLIKEISITENENDN